jgi:hypothetical protein
MSKDMLQETNKQTEIKVALEKAAATTAGGSTEVLFGWAML